MPSRSRRSSRQQTAPLGTMVTSGWRGRVFNGQNVAAVFAASGVPLRDDNIADKLAEAMDDVMHGFVTRFRQEKAATAGAVQEWMLKVETACAALMNLFDVRDPWGRATIEATHEFSKHPPHDAALCRTALRRMQEELKFDGDPGDFATTRAALDGVAFLRERARLVAGRLEKKKGALRGKPWSEIYLIGALHVVFSGATGRADRYTVDVLDSTIGGPFISFATAALSHARDGLSALEPDPARDEGLRDTLTRLATKPSRIRQRLLDMPKSGTAP